MKVSIVAPKETRRFFEFIPKLGYIQGNSSFKIWVKLLAKRELIDICAKYIKNDVL